jgi:RimJ/RimL family protein N-acetyltransferase
VQIHTSRLLLRPWRHDEADRVLAIYSRLDVVRWLGDGPPWIMADLDEAHRTIDRWAARFDVPPLGCWAVEVTETGAVAGTVTLAALPGPGDDVEVAWHLHPDSHGHGYATEAARAVLAHGFAGGLAEVLALTHTDNERSQAVCRRLGMQDRGDEQPWYDVPMRVYALTADAPQRVAVPST